MTIKRRLACLSLATVLATAAVPAAPALADGAASTRNIIIGGAAAALLIINHNRKVHQKYAEYDARQARTQAQASNAEAAYESERQAYLHEASLVSSYQHEVAVQHQEVLRLRHQLAMTNRQNVASNPSAQAFHPLVAGARYVPSAQPVRTASTNTSYGWGAL
jgi:glycerol-3-phosphate dehydrogenase